jgi:hypothetical protein
MFCAGVQNTSVLDAAVEQGHAAGVFSPEAYCAAIIAEAGVVTSLKEEHENFASEYFQATATSSRHMFIADARKARCVLAEMR